MRLEPQTRSVKIWLITICAFLTAMVSIGGITRLTGSGLSITDWAPIMGAIPPLSEVAWQIAFEKYQQIPQFKLVNSGISIDEFKSLFFWEWFHRLIGRLIGVVVLVPGIYLSIRGQLSRPIAKRVLIGFILGGLQGALGWFMVKSGLSERTSVSHFRLAAHLSLALVILSYFVWLTRSVMIANRSLTPEKISVELAAAEFIRPKFTLLAALFVLQIIYGAFVAGMKAGKAFNTFPLMAGSFIPGNLFELEPLWSNLFNNPATVQWIHRTLGWTVFLFANGLWISLRVKKFPRSQVRTWTTALAHMTIVQFIVGVLTLLHAVPVGLGVFHQFGAAVIVILLTVLAHTLNNAKHSA